MIIIESSSLLRLRVLNLMPLIQHAEEQLHCLHLLDYLSDIEVAGDDNVVVLRGEKETVLCADDLAAKDGGIHELLDL